MVYIKNDINLTTRNLFHRIRDNLKIEDFIPPIMFKIKKYITRVKFGKKEFTYVSPILQTFSWEFEDLILADIFLGQKSGHYIDLGCNDPILGNNTYRFYLQGWTGINIDLDESKIKICEEVRPKDICLNIAIDSTNIATSAIFQGSDTSISFLKGSKKYIHNSKDYKLKTIVPLTLWQIYNLHVKDKFVIDILSIDIEGKELGVLMSNNWSIFRPSVIVTEINVDVNLLQEFFSSINYIAVFFNNNNAIFLDEYTQNRFLVKKFTSNFKNISNMD